MVALSKTDILHADLVSIQPSHQPFSTGDSKAGDLQCGGKRRDDHSLAHKRHALPQGVHQRDFEVCTKKSGLGIKGEGGREILLEESKEAKK